MSNQELEVAGYQRVYDYTQYSHENHVNVIPESDFKRLVEDTFKTITNTLRSTYGPYASTVMISDQNETTTTKDGYNVFESIYFSHAYKHKVYIALKQIIDRVNKRVGDGTTSCILLAEKIFHELEKVANTPDEKMSLIKVLNMIEKNLQSSEEIEKNRSDKVIGDLTQKALEGLISMAGNYDDELTKVIREALNPVIEEKYDKVSNKYVPVVKSIRNVVVDAHIEKDGESITTYDVDYLPGDYRIRIHMQDEAALLFEQPRNIKVALYDHAFGSSDWNFFTRDYDKETETLILARDFNREFLNNEYVRYCKKREIAQANIPIILCQVKGNYFKNEIADLAAVLNTDTIGLHAQAVDHESLPTVTVGVHRGNCMYFFTNGYVPTEYIEHLKNEKDADMSDSMIKMNEYRNRINALEQNAKDTLITVKSGTSLELKMISDKIDDCVSIVNSAMEFGIVPNLLQYGYFRINEIKNKYDNDTLTNKVCNGIEKSISGLLTDIWESKHGDQYKEKLAQISLQYYDDKMDWVSFNVIKEAFVDMDELPTSAQYDIEVIVAAISIVKYLLTSRAFIFDAHLMTNVNDEGHYEQI
jgi:chaperonin GroEL (HSP60 family)